MGRVHCCASGQHPKMRVREQRDGRMVFDFDVAVNFHPASAGHMRDASFTFVDPDELRTRSQFREGGKPSEQVANLHPKRVSPTAAAAH